MQHHYTINQIAAALLAVSQTVNAAAITTSSTASNQKRVITCPKVHVFGARETLQPPGFGTAKSVVDSIKRANNGSATSEPIIYPAAGEDEEAYASSARDGVAAVVRQTKSFADMCPESLIVMVGYSQGAQIIDEAFCGGESVQAPKVADAMDSRVAAIIMMGNPRHVDGLPYNVGTAEEGGFAARPEGFTCPDYAERIQSYCDADDPFCAKGNDTAAHQAYGQRYGQEALAFVERKLAEMPPPPPVPEEEVDDKLIVAGQDKQSGADYLAGPLQSGWNAAWVAATLMMVLCA
ncbi:acetylxylan esterase precursor [Apiospora rasikravindrae]|uniref:Acetylxylan esterase n=1 Tax=Apiospora rasikravindrae TaxID=990691 RepID=A0ABR1TZ03_9PEZI